MVRWTSATPSRLSSRRTAWLTAGRVTPSRSTAARKLRVSTTASGAKRLDQLENSLAAVDVALTGDELRCLDKVSELPHEYPGWMLATQDADAAVRYPTGDGLRSANPA